LESNRTQEQAARAQALRFVETAEPATRDESQSLLSNIDIAELLAQQAERETGILSRAFRRAALSAFLWPGEYPI